MKATVLVRLKAEVLDPQGDAVRRALGQLGFEGVRASGSASSSRSSSTTRTPRRRTCRPPAKMADEMLANPVTEDFEVKL